MTTHPIAVFVTSPSLTGTTMLSLILGSLKEAFNCGEPAYLFHHRWQDLDLAWSDFRQNYADRDFWAAVQAEGFERFFPAVHDRTGAKLIIDSSNEQWEKFGLPQREILPRHGFGVRDILVWKTPLEQSYSYYKRDRDVMEWFDKRWVRRLQLFFERVEDPIVVRYRDVAQHPDSILGQICDKLGVAYDPAIKEFWRPPQQCLFGNRGVVEELHQAWETGVHPRGGIVYDDGWKDLPAEVQQRIEEREDLRGWTDKLNRLSLAP